MTPSGPDGPTGLTPAQAGELHELQSKYLRAKGIDVGIPSVCYAGLVSQYLATLALQAAAEGSDGEVAARAAALRRSAVAGFDKYFGREPSAEGIIAELAAVAPVPEPVAAAIRRDLARLAR